MEGIEKQNGVKREVFAEGLLEQKIERVSTPPGNGNAKIGYF